MIPAFVVCHERQDVRPLPAISTATERMLDICFKFWTKICVQTAKNRGMQPQHLIANAVHFEKGLTPAERKENLEQRKIQLESYKKPSVASACASASASASASAPSPLPSNKFAALDKLSDITLQETPVIEELHKPVLKTRGVSAKGGCRSATSAGERASAAQSTKAGRELIEFVCQVSKYAGGIPANIVDFRNRMAWSQCGTIREHIMNSLRELGFPVGTMEEVFGALVELGCIESMDSVIQTKKGNAKSVRKVLCTSAKPTASHASSCCESQRSQEAFPALSRSSNRSAAGGGGSAPAPDDATTVVVPVVGGGGSADLKTESQLDSLCKVYAISMLKMKQTKFQLDNMRDDDTIPVAAAKALDEIHAHCEALTPRVSLSSFLAARKVIEVNREAGTFRVISN
jgi:hypothetical protein